VELDRVIPAGNENGDSPPLQRQSSYGIPSAAAARSTIIMNFDDSCNSVMRDRYYSRRSRS